MDAEVLFALAGFAFMACITPGPNNFMLMSSGTLFGFKRTVPHIAGVQFGFATLVAAAVFGLGAVISQLPWLVTVVKIIGAAWLLWLALNFFKAALNTGAGKSSKNTESRSRPFKFYEAAFFQWANPKALLMAISAAGAFFAVAESTILRAFIMCGTFLVFGIMSSSLWTFAGHTLNRLMSSGRSAQILNAVMGILIVVTALFILLAKAQ